MKGKPKRRYLIETANADYWCDDYKISPFQGINAISVDGDTVDAFTIYDAITAIHDYESKISLRKFASIKRHEAKTAHELITNLQQQQTRPVNDPSAQ